MNLNAALCNEKLFRAAQIAQEPLLQRRTRRTLVVALGVAGTALAVAALSVPFEFAWVVLQLALVPQLIAFPWLARRGTRGLALAPSHLLDELQLQQVHSAFRRAYGITVAALVGLVVMNILAGFLSGHFDYLFRVGAVGVFFLVQLMVWLPTAILAWRLNDEDPNDLHTPAV
ncbi:hypothetical protein [Streptomyces sioyaensis]|uniref:hypothetical protein n=1 Tax=Streptomyces sioyaensis TaxID=67364 RepID=UPI003791BBCD